MLVYRTLLVDTERSYVRPIQSYFSDERVAQDWALRALASAGKHAYVQIYRSDETEYKRVSNDEGTTPRIQSAKA